MTKYTLDLWPSRTRIDLVNPDPAAYCIEDIAWGLSWEMRFANQIPDFYSVAEHCLLGVRIADAVADEVDDVVDVKRRVLLHDAAEGVGWKDIPSPIKALVPEYKRYEKLHQRAIYTRFGLDPHPEHDALVKAIDDRLYHIEDRYFRHDERPDGFEGIRCFSPAVARVNFMTTFRELFPEEAA